jgi:o-succinylbenzoate synthase
MEIIKVQSCKYNLKFKFEAGTSRGVMNDRDTWFILIRDENGVTGIGECAPIPGLSPDAINDFDSTLSKVCSEIQKDFTDNGNFQNTASLVADEFPSIKMGVETAVLDYLHQGKRHLFDSNFIKGQKKILINGLIWMGERDFMQKQISLKLAEGYSCIKMKIGAIDFETEYELLKQIRKKHSPESLVLRVDANGSFKPSEVMQILDKLAILGIHSIEQPLKPEFTEELVSVSKNSPVPIALDESLIGHYGDKAELLDLIRPAYIVLKPTLLGGFSETADWIRIAESKKTGWWITSALESNIGLNAICQFTAQYPVHLHQGLGTGQLYQNNISAPIETKGELIYYNDNKKWDLSPITSLVD